MTTSWTQPALRWTSSADSTLALTLIALMELEIWVFNSQTQAPVVASIIAPIAGGAVAFRRLRPFPAYLVNVAAIGALIALGNPSSVYQWTNLIMVFSIAVYGRNREAWVGLVTALMGVSYYFLSLPIDGGQVILVGTLGIWVAVWLAAKIYRGQRTEQTLRHDRDLATALAATHQERLELESERTEMARELHDLIGHTVNVMVVHAEGGRRAVRPDPEAAERALETIASTGRAALDELDRLLGVLRRDSAHPQLHPAPSLTSLPALQETFIGAGLTVELDVSGDISTVPAGIGISAYRIAQASLTNVLRHAGSTTARVGVRAGSETLDLVISDDGAGRPLGAGDGRGIRGVRERVALHGGEVHIGNRPGGGFEVVCGFPLAEPR